MWKCSVLLICTHKRKQALGLAKRVQWVIGSEGGGFFIHPHGGSWAGRGLTLEQAASSTLGIDPGCQASYPRKVQSHHSLKALPPTFCAFCANCSYFKVQLLIFWTSISAIKIMLPLRNIFTNGYSIIILGGFSRGIYILLKYR